MLWMIWDKTLKGRVRSRKSRKKSDWCGDDQRVLENPKIMSRSLRKNEGGAPLTAAVSIEVNGRK